MEYIKFQDNYVCGESSSFTRIEIGPISIGFDVRNTRVGKNYAVLSKDNYKCDSFAEENFASKMILIWRALRKPDAELINFGRSRRRFMFSAVINGEKYILQRMYDFAVATKYCTINIDKQEWVETEDIERCTFQFNVIQCEISYISHGTLYTFNGAKSIIITENTLDDFVIDGNIVDYYLGIKEDSK